MVHILQTYSVSQMLLSSREKEEGENVREDEKEVGRRRDEGAHPSSLSLSFSVQKFGPIPSPPTDRPT